jgi:DNA repair exonuclease SbcCD ATPase subunit|tara:strand:- start:42 stop:491 length:450 start_codon:yes stop_codon:yes gene_type:complete
MADLNQLATDLQVLKNEVDQVASVNTKLDSAIDKLTDISGSIKSMLAVHEEKLSKQEEIDKAIFNLIENRRVEFDTNYKELHARINKIHKELTDEIEMSEKRLMCEIKTLNSNLDGRIGVFEKYRWIIIGAAIVLGLSMPQILSVIKII